MVGMIGCGKCEYFWSKIFGHEVIPISHGVFYIIINTHFICTFPL